jgi:hypothetical protein
MIQFFIVYLLTFYIQTNAYHWSFDDNLLEDNNLVPTLCQTSITNPLLCDNIQLS